MTQHLRNPFQAQTQLGASIASLGQAIFGNRQSPRDAERQAQETALTRARAQNAEANARTGTARLGAQQELSDLLAGVPALGRAAVAPVVDPGVAGLPRVQAAQAIEDNTRSPARRSLADLPYDLGAQGAFLADDPQDLANLMRLITAIDPAATDNEVVRARAGAGGTLGPGQSVSVGGQRDLLNDNARRAIDVRNAQPRTLAEVRGNLLGENFDTLEALDPAQQKSLGAQPTEGRGQTALQEKITEIMNTYGVDRQTAVGAAAGLVGVTPDRAYGGVNITDKVRRENQYIPPVTNALPGGEPPTDALTNLPRGIDYSQGTGGSGFFGWAANTVADAVGGRLPAPEAEDAVQGLTNLFIRTQTMMQAVVPGRPSQYLLEELAKLAVKPANLMMGDRRAYTRVKQTQAMLNAEIEKLDRDIMSQPGAFSRNELAATRKNISDLGSLVRDYDVVVSSFATALGVEDQREAPQLSPEDDALIQKYLVE